MPDAIGIFTFAAQVAEVEVDEVTGQVEVLEFWSAHDVGRAINTASVEGQIEGGIAQMLGYALTEENVVGQRPYAQPEHDGLQNTRHGGCPAQDSSPDH